MSTASMSRFIEQARGRLHYRCTECVSKDAGVPVSTRTPLRVLHLYALISTEDGGLTPLRMKEVRIVVSTPPDTWGWSVASAPELHSDPYMLAQPKPSSDTRGNIFHYSGEEPDALWNCSTSFLGRECD